MQQEVPYLGVRYMIRYHVCNLKCPYCIARGDEKAYRFDHVRFNSMIDRLMELPYRICLRFGIGGEPYTSPDFLDGVKRICNTQNNIFGVSFSTNLVADWDRIIGPFIQSVDTSRLGMGCTLHDMVIDDVDGFFAKVGKLKKAGVLVYVGLVAIPGRLHLIRRYWEICRDLEVPLIMNGLLGRMQGEGSEQYPGEYPMSYTCEELAELRELWDSPHSYQILLESSTTRGMDCSAGRNYVYVNHDGDVFPCAQIKSSIGNLLRKDVRFQEEDTICPMQSCWCGNENQALRIIDRNYDRTRTLRIFTPKAGLRSSDLYEGYNPSIFDRGCR